MTKTIRTRKLCHVTTILDLPDADRDAAEIREERLRAIERLRDLRRGVTLGGEDIRDLIEQGRRN